MIIRGHCRNREIALVISLGHRDSVLTKWRLICPDRTSRRGDDDIIRVGTALRSACTARLPRAALTLCNTLLHRRHALSTMSSVDLSKLTAAESPEDREAAATEVAKQVTSKVR